MKDWGQTIAADKGTVAKAELLLNIRKPKWEGKKNQELFPLHEELWSELSCW